MSSNSPLLELIDIELFERPVLLRLPFKFGVVTLTHCPQAFVRVQVRTAGGKIVHGGAAEVMAPKWFDKNLALSNEDNFNQLRDVLRGITMRRNSFVRSAATTRCWQITDPL